MSGRRLGGQREQKGDANERVALITQYGADLDRFGATATADRGHVGTEALGAAHAADDQRRSGRWCASDAWLCRRAPGLPRRT